MFIILTLSQEDRKIRINADHIKVYFPAVGYHAGDTEITCKDNSGYYVKEAPEDIDMLLKKLGINIVN